MLSNGNIPKVYASGISNVYMHVFHSGELEDVLYSRVWSSASALCCVQFPYEGIESDMAMFCAQFLSLVSTRLFSIPYGILLGTLSNLTI